jgi:hypothetical protein
MFQTTNQYICCSIPSIIAIIVDWMSNASSTNEHILLQPKGWCPSERFIADVRGHITPISRPIVYGRYYLLWFI